jgi:hypothetical protein
MILKPPSIMKKTNHLRVVHKNVMACSYKLFSRLTSILMPSDEPKTEEKNLIDHAEDEEQTIRGKRIAAHQLFALRNGDAIKEDGFVVR